MIDAIALFAFEIFTFLTKVGMVFLALSLLIKMVIGGVKSGEEEGALKVSHLNEKYKHQGNELKRMLMTPEARLIAQKVEAKQEKGEAKKKKREAKRELKKSKRAAKQLKLNSDSKESAVPKEVESAVPQEGKSAVPQEGKSAVSKEVESAVSKEDESVSHSHKPRLFVIDFKGDIQASAVESLREEVTAVIQVCRGGDEVLLKLNNSGGYVHTHGLAASQLKRLSLAGVRLTIAIDQIAASGGYMMACVGDRIIAAPFAIIGSIGVVAQVPNINRLLKRYDVDIELHTAGEFKRTLTVLGENTDEGRAKFKEDLHKTHELFQDFVKSQREELNVEEVSTGETWYGAKALEAGLIDEIKTSDEVLLESLPNFDIYSVEYQRKRKMSERAFSVAHSLLSGRLPESY